MQPTMNLRIVIRKIKLPPNFNVYTGHPTEKVLQQWWHESGEPPPSSYGEWRDVPIESEK